MKGQKQIFSTGKDDWGTPPAFISYLEKELNIILGIDLAASAENAVAGLFLTEDTDFLKHECKNFSGDAWLNPPYSQNEAFIKHAAKVARPDFRIWILIPSRTDTAYWHDSLSSGALFFIRGRLKFVGAKSGAPFPSCVVCLGALAGQMEPVNYLSPTPKERGF
jgi:phage N-6-adenine-methyltransferase